MIRARDPGWKILGSDIRDGTIRIRYPGWNKFGSGMKKIRIRDRDKHPGSATLVVRSALSRYNDTYGLGSTGMHLTNLTLAG